MIECLSGDKPTNSHFYSESYVERSFLRCLRGLLANLLIDVVFLHDLPRRRSVNRVGFLVDHAKQAEKRENLLVADDIGRKRDQKLLERREWKGGNEEKRGRKRSGERRMGSVLENGNEISPIDRSFGIPKLAEKVQKDFI